MNAELERNGANYRRNAEIPRRKAHNSGLWALNSYASSCAATNLRSHLSKWVTSCLEDGTFTPGSLTPRFRTSGPAIGTAAMCRQRNSAPPQNVVPRGEHLRVPAARARLSVTTVKSDGTRVAVHGAFHHFHSLTTNHHVSATIDLVAP